MNAPTRAELAHEVKRLASVYATHFAGRTAMDMDRLPIARDSLHAAIDALAASPAPQQDQRAPAVPMVTTVTDAMHVAACKVLTRANGLHGLPQRMLNAMLAVAPSPSPTQAPTPASAFDLTEAQSIVVDAIRRMRAAHVDCHDLTMKAEAFLQATHAAEQAQAPAEAGPVLDAMVEKAWDRFEGAMDKANRVRSLVNTGHFPGMSDAFNAHMGADVWIEPEYAPDASTWAAAWKAALASQPRAQPLSEAELQALNTPEPKPDLLSRLHREADAGCKSDVSLIDALEFRRDAYGLTREEFAGVLGCWPGHFSEVMSGKRRLPSLAMRRAFAVGVPAAALLQHGAPAATEGEQ